MENLDHDPIILTGRAPDQLRTFVTHENPTSRLHDYSRTLQHIYAGTFFVMYVPLVAFIQVKFQRLDDCPFETHAFIIIMSLLALPVAVTTSGILFNSIYPSENTNISLLRYVFLKFAFYFSTILAVLSLILVLFVPRELNWIGYAIVCALFAVMVVYNFGGYIRLLVEKKDVAEVIV